MSNYSKAKTIYSILFILFLHTTAYAQSNTYNFDTNDIFIIKSPSKNYKDIVLQSHNGIPRFGVLNTYIASNASRNLDLKEKYELIIAGDMNFLNLIQMDYMKAMYNDFNREVRASTRPSGTNKKEENSYKAQQQFYKLTNTVCTDIAGNINAGENEFERRRNYKTFVNNNLDGLLTWSNTILKNNAFSAYWVHTVRLRNYDFDKKGYWIQIPIASIRERNTRFSTQYNFFKNHVPKNSYESFSTGEKSRSSSTTSLKILFKISPEEAEKLQQPTKFTRGTSSPNPLYATAKVKVTLRAFTEDKSNKTPEIPEFEHHFESPIITLYKDLALTEKVAELSLKKIITED